MVRCLPELGDLTLVSSGQDSRLYGRWRLIHFAERYWRNISLMQTDSQTSEKLMGGNSGELMSSPEDSLAKMFPQPTLMAKDWMDSEADYGLRCAESLASYDRPTSSWRTSQICLTGELSELSGTWPRSAMTRNGRLFPLPDSDYRT